MRPEDGSPLSLACDMRRSSKLQSFPTLSDLHHLLLLDLFRRVGVVGMARGPHCRWGILRRFHADQLHHVSRHCRHHRTRPSWLHGLAYLTSMAERDDDRVSREDEVPQSVAKVV